MIIILGLYCNSTYVYALKTQSLPALYVHMILHKPAK